MEMGRFCLLAVKRWGIVPALAAVEWVLSRGHQHALGSGWRVFCLWTATWVREARGSVGATVPAGGRAHDAEFIAWRCLPLPGGCGGWAVAGFERTVPGEARG